MSRMTVWYRGLGKSSKILVIAVAAVVLLAVVGAIGYMVFHPQKVQVRYGTIVRDPVDGHVWEDNTKTAWVDPSQADNYRVEYVDKLSPEHEEQATAQAAQEQQAAGQSSSGLSRLQAPIDSKTMEDLETLQANIETAGNSLISGMEMASQISDTKSTLVNYRNQLAAIPVAPELEPLKQQGLQVFDMYIQACDLLLQGIANTNMAQIQQAGDLINQANAKVQSLMPQ
jgi:flagellar basal body-associated protein FliL